MRLTDLRRVVLRLASHLRSPRVESELSREVEAHLRLIEDDLVARGMSREEARYAARRAFGGVEQMKERQRDARGFRFLTGWRMDLALALRMTMRHWALSVIAIFGITVAIAIAATIFTLMSEELNPSDLPLPDGRRIVALMQWDAAKNNAQPLGAADVVAWRDGLSTVRHLGAFRTLTKTLIVPPAAPQPIEVAEMSAAGFDVAGVAPAMGRAIRPGDEQPGAAPVVVIGHDEWRDRFRANPGVLNMSVQLGAAHYTIVGVMPEGFAFPINHAYWIPLRLDAFAQPGGGGQPAGLSAFGRLVDGATLESAQAELTAVGERARTASPSTHEHLRPRVVSYAHQFAEMRDPDAKLERQMVRFFITLLLLVISINVAVLVYARTAARQAEIAVRTALGASRGRIIAQMFTEGLVLAGLGALAGVSLAAVALEYVTQTMSEGEPSPFWYRFTISGDTIVYVVALTALAAALIGALPAWKATGARIQSRLQTLSAGGGSGMQLGRVWTALIVLQVAFAVALLPTVLLVALELAGEGAAQVRFAADEYLVAQLSAEAPSTAPAPAGSNDSFARQYRALEGRIAETGTVHAITFSTFTPGDEADLMVRSDVGVTDTSVEVNRVAVNFFDTFGARVLAGRDFTNGDAEPQGRTVIVSRAFAQALPQGAAVLGSRIRLATRGNWARAVSGLGDDWHQVVGIVEDFSEPASGTKPTAPKVYKAITPDAASSLVLALRVQAADVNPWITRLQHTAAALDPTLQLTNVRSMAALLRENQRNAHLLASVMGTLTLSVLLLSAAGIYAMMSLAVAQRRREIGIRLALGAGARGILWTIFSRSAAQLLLGAALGTAVALLLNHAENGELLKNNPTLVMTGVVLLVTVAGLLAALGPARQGLRIEPTEALREPSR